MASYPHTFPLRMHKSLPSESFGARKAYLICQRSPLTGATRRIVQQRDAPDRAESVVMTGIRAGIHPLPLGFWQVYSLPWLLSKARCRRVRACAKSRSHENKHFG